MPRESVTDVEGDSHAPSLRGLLRASAGPPTEVVHRALVLACELLDMDVAYVTVLDRGADPVHRTVVRAVSRDGEELTRAVGLAEPLADTWCARVVAEGCALVPDVALHPELGRLPTTSAFGIVSHAGVTIPGPDGPVAGTLCVLGHRPAPSLNARDGAVLRALADEIAPLLPVLDRPVEPDADPGRLPASALTAMGVEDLTRPLLEALHQVTRLGSTYLTQVLHDGEEQVVRVALNTRSGFEVPEGLRVPWTDTLCRRALEEGRVCTTDVPAVWGDSQAAAALGVQVYVSVPVELADGQVWGTLCAADSLPAAEVDQHLPTLRLFSRLIAAEVDRTQQIAGHLDRSAVSAERARLVADTDELTGCARRHLVQPWLEGALAAAGPEEQVVLAFLDVDDFKAVNDTHGHAAGDAVLVELARRLRRVLRAGDLLARYGGDELVVAAVVPSDGPPDVLRRVEELSPLVVRHGGEDLRVSVSVGVARHPGGGDPRDGRELVARADHAMYEVKRARAGATVVPAPRRGDAAASRTPVGGGS